MNCALSLVFDASKKIKDNELFSETHLKLLFIEAAEQILHFNEKEAGAFTAGELPAIENTQRRRSEGDAPAKPSDG